MRKNRRRAEHDATQIGVRLQGWSLESGALDFRGNGTEGDIQGRMCGSMFNLDQAVDLVRHTLVMALIISAPLLLIGLAVGLIISIFQAVTQIQEQTLTFIPKIVAMVAAAIILMPWIGQQLVDYAAAMFSSGMNP